jgi:hypothetical protein
MSSSIVAEYEYLLGNGSVNTALNVEIKAETAAIFLGKYLLAAVSVAKNLKKVIPVTTQKNTGTVPHGDFYSDRPAIIKGSSFVH